MEANRTITVIEISSSKIKGAVAETDTRGNIRVLAVERYGCTDCVRHGRVRNVREVSSAVNEVISRLHNQPALVGKRIKSATVSLGGRSVCAVPTSTTMQFGSEIEVTEATISRLKSDAAKDFAGNANIEATLSKAFWVNNVAVKPAVGTVGSTLRGEFMLVTCAKETRQNLERLKFEALDASNIDFRLQPLAVADLVLTSDQKQVGVVLVDFGAETSTVSVYKGGVLIFLATLPMGSRLITMDLMTGLHLTEAAAEDFKINASAKSADEADEEINNYIRARSGEIAANIVHQIELSGLNPNELGSGIVLTGGGARLPEFAPMLAAQAKMEVHKAEIPPYITFSKKSDDNEENIDIVALIADAATRPECALRNDLVSVEQDIDIDSEPAEKDADDDFEIAYAASKNKVKPNRLDDDRLLSDDPDEEEEPREEVEEEDIVEEEEPEEVKPRKPAPSRPEQKRGSLFDGIKRGARELAQRLAKIYDPTEDDDVLRDSDDDE